MAFCAITPTEAISAIVTTAALAMKWFFSSEKRADERGMLPSAPCMVALVVGFQVEKVTADSSRSEQVRQCMDLERFIH
jgi:hypothetical protein